MSRRLTISYLAIIFQLNHVLSQDTIRLVYGDTDYFEFVNEQCVLKDTATAAHYMIYSRYFESILVREFDVIDHKLNGKDIAYNFPFDFPYAITHWKNGLMDGRYTLYKGDTIPDLEIEMENGWPNGEYSKYQISGDTVLRVLHGHFTHGIMDSVWTQYISEGPYRPCKYIQSYTYKDGELYFLSWQFLNGKHTLLNGDGYISTTNGDTSFYKMGKLYKLVINSKGAYNVEKLSEITEVTGEGIINKKIIKLSDKSGLYPVFESNYLIDGYCIDTTLEILDINSIQYFKLQKNYKLIPHGKFINYQQSYNSSFHYYGLKENPEIYNSLINNPYIDFYNYVYNSNNLANYSQMQYQYGVITGVSLMSNGKIIVQIDANTKTETRTSYLGNTLDEMGIYFLTAGKPFFLHVDKNQKSITLSNQPSDIQDIKIRFDHIGNIYLDNNSCPEVIVGKYNFLENTLFFYNNAINSKEGKWHFNYFKPSKLSNEGIILKGYSNLFE